MFNIITTKRKSTAIAPTYTTINNNAMNSTPKKNSNPDTLQNTKIRNKTECTALEDQTTINALTRAKLENK